MTGRLGVLVAVLALSATASARPKSAPVKKAPAAPVEAPPAADGSAVDGSATDGSAEAEDDDVPPHLVGPKLVDLGNNTEIDLPADLILVERDAGVKFVEKRGGSGEDLEALVFSPDGDWWIRIDYSDAGYVSDKDASDLDANAILSSFQQGTAEQNQRRRTLGLPDLFLDGWTDMPGYEKTAHHLTWGLKGHSTKGVSINEFTRILGRNGFLSVDLIASPDKLDAAKIAAAPTLAAVRFKTGFTYEEHKDGDKSSGMGLKALVLGGAGVAAYSVAKGGVVLKLLVVLGKGVVVVLAGVAAFFKKIFGRGKSTQLPPDGPPVG